jgi:adenine-specific DNA-methyltransferase
MPTLDWLNRDAAFRIAEKAPYRLLEFVSEHRAAAAHAANPTSIPAAQKSKSEAKAEPLVAAQSEIFERKDEKTSDSAPQVSAVPPLPGGEGRGEGGGDAKQAQVEAKTAFAPTHDNLLIQGDNLAALKALLPLYRGQVKCIFIDPPYNTKSAFEHYDDNLEHAQWLSMMLPRLQLLREFLREDGSIWVTIDDNEGHYLKVMMDEVFGRGNFVANVVWRSADSSNNDAKQFSLDHNHVIVFSKSKGWLSKPLERTEASDAHYKNPDFDPRGAWFAGNVSSPKPRENLKYSIFSPENIEIFPPANGWRWSKETMAELISSREIVFTNGGTKILKKTYLSEQDGLSPSTVWDDIEETGHNRQAKYELKKLFPGKETSDLFGTPKPERVVMQAINIATNPNDLILDSFLGSGTTAAVAHKMGRRWIGIEMGEHAHTHCLPRLQKVLDGEPGGISKAVNWQGGGSFQFVKLGAPIFSESGDIAPQVRFKDLAAFVWQQETHTAWQKHLKRGEAASSPLLGTHNGVAIFLLFNGILGDRRPQSGNVLTGPVLAWLKESAPQVFTKSAIPAAQFRIVIYGEACRMGEPRLAAEGITFRQIPYEIA